MKIACFGDSLTYGWIGYSYRKYINKEHNTINKGINGDTTLHVYERLEEYIQKHNKDVDIFVLHVGLNDILLPYIANISPLWKIQMGPRVKGMRCIQNDEKFKEAYEKYFKLFQKYACKAIIVGMPMCQLQSFPNDITQRRNEIISKLADKYDMPFIDSYNMQTKAVKYPHKIYSWKHKNILRSTDALFMMIAPFTKDCFSKVRGLDLTVDGVHYNSLSAKLIGEAINKAIEVK